MRIKKIILLLVVMSVTFWGFSFQAGAVVNFTKHGNTPVFSAGSSGAFDEMSLERPTVIKDGSTYKMWYMGQDASGVLKIGYATSTDGIAWTRGNNGNPVLSAGAAGDWDSAHVGAQWVIKEGSVYKMWFTGTDDSTGEGNLQIGYATSPDGITWTKYNDGTTPTNPFANSDPVLPKGTGGVNWDGTGVFAPVVINDGGVYTMWYVGFDAGLQSWGIGYATSPDGITWTKSDNPVLTAGPPGSWDATEIEMFTVIKEDDIYRLWYCSSETNGPDRIGYASSTDGINWRKYHGNPVIMEGNQATDDFDEFSAYDPMVIKDGNIYKMWYVGEKDCAQVEEDWECVTSIGYAESPAYPGSHAAINTLMVESWNRLGTTGLYAAAQVEGPGPLDITEIKVEGPGGFFYRFKGTDIESSLGTQYYAANFPGNPAADGLYTFTLKTNNGLTVTNSLTLTKTSLPDMPDEALEAHTNGVAPPDMVYAGSATPTFKWKPAAGDNYYYRIQVKNWENNRNFYFSPLVPGSSKDGEGYLYAMVPAGILPANTPFRWRVQALDSAEVWSAHNRSLSNWYRFYTSLKDDSTSPDFLGGALLFSRRTFQSGEQTIFSANVVNLAPWDIDTATAGHEFRVDDSANNLFFTYSPGDHAWTPTPPYGFSYSTSIEGFPPGNGDYTFKVFDLSGHSEFLTKSFTFDPAIPMVDRRDMAPADNSYLTTVTPTLSWLSLGSSYQHRVGIQEWNQTSVIYMSNWTTGVNAGQTMEVTVPAGVLRVNAPYRWYVEVSDINRNNASRSPRLAFTIPSETATVSGQVTAGTSGYTAGNIFIGAYDGPDPRTASLMGSTVIGNIADSYRLDNLPVGVHVYIWAFWDKDGNGELTTGDYVGTSGQLVVAQGGSTAPSISLNSEYTGSIGSPFFDAATVLAFNSPDGLQTAFTARVFDPNGSLPGSIANFTVTAPGGASYNISAAEYNATFNNYFHAVPGLLAEGEYTLAVTDTEGKLAVTYVYFKPGDTVIPLPDTTTFQASGSLSAPTLSWASALDYPGNLFYRARIYDMADNVIWTSDFSPQTSVEVPSGDLAAETSYQWRVEAFDAYHYYASNKRSVSAKVPLSLDNTHPYFNYATAQQRSDNGTISLALEVGVADPDGIGLPDAIASIVVTAPDNATYNLLPTDFSGTSYYHKFSGVTPLTGIYAFTVTDTNQNSATSYDYLEVRDIPVVDQSSLQASGNPLAPVLSWGAPEQMDRPLYFRARIYDTAGNTIWSSGRSVNTSVQVPEGNLQQDVAYQWHVRTEDDSYGIHTSNQSRTPMINLTMDDSRPYFQNAAVYKRHTPDGFYTAMAVRVLDPDGTVPDDITSLAVTGPGVDYTFVPENYTAADNQYYYQIPGKPTAGIYTFTASDTGSHSAVTHEIVMAADDIPIINESSVLVSGDPSAPTISWSGIAGYAGRPEYRVTIRDSQGNTVFRSNRFPNTALTIPSGTLAAGQNYQFRIEAQDHRHWVTYNSRSDSGWLPLNGPPVQHYLASGTFSYVSDTLTLSITSSDFVCDGPEAGATDEFTVLWQSATTVILLEPGNQMTWTRAAGTIGDLVGTWQMTEGPNTFDMTFSSDNSFMLSAGIAECSQDGVEEEGSEAYSVWTGITRSMTGGGTTDTKILHFHLWAPTGTVTQVYVAAPTHPPDPANYTFTEYDTYLRGEVMVDDFSKDVPITVDPEVGDLYIFTVTKVGADPVTMNQYLGEIILDAPLVTSPTGHDLADANLGGVLNITWAAPAAFSANEIMIQGGVCAPGGDESVSGTVTSATTGTIDLPDLAGATGAYIDIRVHHGDHVFSNTKYDFGTCDYAQDTIPPTVPTGLAPVPVGPRQIDLSWTASTDNNWVEGYKVYRDGNEIFTTTATTFSDTNLAPYTNYCYTVKAYDYANNFSDLSSQACATTLPAFNAYSYHQQDGYFINAFVEDPGQLFFAVTINGPGLSNASMTYNASSGRWEIPSVLLGTTLPTGPHTYDFSATPAAGGGPVTGSVTVSVFVEQFATNLQPTGDVTTPYPTFSWTGFPQATSYTVIVGDLSYNWFWTSPMLQPDQTSVVYDGPAFSSGQTYLYEVVSGVNTDGNSNSSFAEAQFTYVPPAIAGDINTDGHVDLADAILALQVLSGMNPPGISLGGEANADGKIGVVEVIYIFQVLGGTRQISYNP